MGCGSSSSTRVVVPFIWGYKGSVLIKSLKLVITYDPSIRGIAVSVPNDRITESLLSWQNRRFYIEDLFITDLKLNKKFKCPGIKACFTISDYDQFEDLQEKDQLLARIKQINGRNIDHQKSNILLNGIKNDCKDLWNFAKEFWVKNKNLNQRTDIVSFGRNCIASTVEKRADPSKLQEFIGNKYKASNFVRMKKDIKAKIVMEKEDYRPHIVKVRKSTLVNFFVDTQHLLEVQEEIKIFIFCWEDIPELSDPEYFKSEIQKMQLGTKLVYNELQEEINNLINMGK